MSKINVFLGLNVQNLKFQCGGAPLGFDNGVVTYFVNATERKMIESNLHPKEVTKKVISDIKYCYGKWDLNISTHSEVIINVLAALITTGQINREEVFIFILEDDNSKIKNTSFFNEDIYLENWPYGFFDYDYEFAKNFNFSL